METVRHLSELRERLARARSEGTAIGLVPTMGSLHEGHLSLVREARRHVTHVVASIYINPTQFGPNEDLASYPRDVEGDRRKLERAGADTLFLANESEMYPRGVEGNTTWVNVEGITERLCGARRPGHFLGVTTVVAKLFNMVQPDVAVFGDKDYQQLMTIRRMVDELAFPVRVLSGPIVREEDGLAMSSRNAYLSAAQREQATCLYRALQATRRRFSKGERRRAALLAIALDLVAAEPEATLQYAELVDPESLVECGHMVGEEALLALAVHVGNTRLIDNLRLDVASAR